MASHATAARNGIRGRGNRTIQAVVLTFALIATMLPAVGALAQETNQVTGLAAEQQSGFATLSWEPLRGPPTTRSSELRSTPATSPPARQ